MDFFKNKSAKIELIQAKLKNPNLSLKERLILMVKLMILGFGKQDS